MRTHFATHLELARLPYFELRQGRLALADPELGPAIDFHTHLALAYLRPMRVDLQQLHPATRHYLDVTRPLDLQIYANQNFSREEIRRMTRDLTLASTTASGMRQTHTAANLLREMAELHIQTSVLLAIDMPLLSDNAGAYLRAAASRPGLVVFGSVHPYAAHMEQRLRSQAAAGVRGIKVHPAVQLVRPDWDRPMALYHLCGQLDLPVLFHCGPVGIELRLSRHLSQVRFYRRALAECPQTTFVLGHAGALQWEEALELARCYENVYLELASQSLPAMRQILQRGPTKRVLFGTDWPFYHQAMGLAKVLLLTEGRPDLRRKVLFDNATRLLNRG